MLGRVVLRGCCCTLDVSPDLVEVDVLALLDGLGLEVDEGVVVLRV